MASAREAGILKAKSIIEDVNLMYNDSTAKRYYTALIDELRQELAKRGIFVKFYD